MSDSLQARKIRRRSGEPHIAPVFTGSRSEVDDVIARADDFGVVLDDDDGVAVVAQLLEDPHEPAGIARVEADRRLVQDVERVHERGPDRRGEVDALQLASGERPGLPVEREVAETDLDEVAEARADLFEDEVRHLRLRTREVEASEEAVRLRDAHRVDFTDVLAFDLPVQSFGTDTSAAHSGQRS